MWNTFYYVGAVGVQGLAEMIPCRDVAVRLLESGYGYYCTQGQPRQHRR